MIVGPWQCDECKQLSAYADKKSDRNEIFCRNCGFRRTVHTKKRRIIENDGTLWEYDGAGNKTRVRMQ